jgi:hypothetical protein
MSSASSSRKTANTTSNVQQTDQSYRDSSQKDSNNTYLDGGVIRSAFDFSTDTVNRSLNTVTDTTKASLDFSGDTVNNALNTVDNSVNKVLDFGGSSLALAERSTQNALDFAFNISKESGAPGSDMAKYALIGAAVIGAAMVIKK